MPDGPTSPDSPRDPRWAPRESSTNEPAPIPTSPVERRSNLTPTQASDSFMERAWDSFDRHYNAIANTTYGILIGTGGFQASQHLAEGDLRGAIISAAMGGFMLTAILITGRSADSRLARLEKRIDK